jgi:hypothetical protein
VYTIDFIDDAHRTNFNSFEGLPATPPLVAGLYIEDGVRVEQMPFPNNTINTRWWWSGSPSDPKPPDGLRSWYPSGGDEGYTRITRADGSDFFNVGFMRGSGQPGFDAPGVGSLLYQLYNNGGLVLSGAVPHTQLGQYLGFSGGGFDEIRVRDGQVAVVTSFYDGTRNALALDAIELSAPEPCSASLLTTAILSLLLNQWRRWRRAGKSIPVEIRRSPSDVDGLPVKPAFR